MQNGVVVNPEEIIKAEECNKSKTNEAKFCENYAKWILLSFRKQRNNEGRRGAGAL
jgi:hypothetical protein